MRLVLLSCIPMNQSDHDLTSRAWQCWYSPVSDEHAPLMREDERWRW